MVVGKKSVSARRAGTVRGRVVYSAKLEKPPQPKQQKKRSQPKIRSLVRAATKIDTTAGPMMHVSTCQRVLHEVCVDKIIAKDAARQLARAVTQHVRDFSDAASKVAAASKVVTVTRDHLDLVVSLWGGARWYDRQSKFDRKLVIAGRVPAMKVLASTMPQ